MESSPQPRSVVLNELYKECKFQFQESELSPNLRNQIGILEEKLQECWQTNVKAEKVEGVKRSLDTISGLFIFFGLILIAISFSYGADFLVVGVVCFLFVWPVYSYSKRKSLDKAVLLGEYKIKMDAWHNSVEALSREIFDELSLIHGQKVSPSIKQEVVQYNISTKFEFGKNGALMIECPYCKASSQLTSKINNTVKCSYCGKEYIIPNKVLQLL